MKLIACALIMSLMLGNATFTQKATTSNPDKDMGELYSLVLDSYIPLDSGLNWNMQFIAIDFSTLKNLDSDDKDYIINYFKKYNIKVIDSNYKELRAKKMFDPETLILDGLLLEIEDVKFSDHQIIIKGKKFRSGDGSILVKTTIVFKDGKWQIDQSKSGIIGIS